MQMDESALQSSKAKRSIRDNDEPNSNATRESR
jgi:hypothetical protein